MALDGDALGDAVLAAMDGEDPRDVEGGETMADYRKRLERARGRAIVSYLVANTVVSVAPVVAIGIPVTVAFPAGTGATTATGTSSDNAGTIS